MYVTNASYRAFAILGVLAASTAFPMVAAATPPDSTLFTTYRVATDLKSASWLVCGSKGQSEGCYDSGSIGPFGQIGAMLESAPVTSGNTVSRKVYVLDIARGNNSEDVSLFVYIKKDVLTESDDTVSVKLDKIVALPLVGGKTVTGMMAANSLYLYIGTNQSYQAVSVDKNLWTVTGVGGFEPAIPVAAITANSYGFVTVTFGAPGGEFSGFYTFGPTGALQEDGGGAEFTLDDFNSVTPAALP